LLFGKNYKNREKTKRRCHCQSIDIKFAENNHMTYAETLKSSECRDGYKKPILNDNVT